MSIWGLPYYPESVEVLREMWRTHIFDRRAGNEFKL
jgi:hypothetical protein